MKLRVAYAKSRYKDRVYLTPLVVTSYRDENGVARNKTLLNLSKLPDPIIKLIERALKQGDEDVLEEYLPLSQVRYLESVVVGPCFVVLSILRQLGIFALVMSMLTFKQALAIIAIIAERVTSPRPASVMALQRRFAKSPLAFLLNQEKSPNLRTWYGALAKLEACREEILQKLFKRHHPDPGGIFLYDITSSYFEGDSCVLAAFGYNRDGKKGKKQVVIGVMCDGEGCPIWIDVFKGNTSDQTTVKQQLLTLKEKLGVERFTFVGDRGMVTNARIEELEQEGWWESFCYISALTRQEMMSLVEDEQHPIQLELFDHENLMEVDHKGTRYVLCHNPQRRERDRETRERLLALTEEKLESIRKNVDAGRIKKKDVIAKRLYRWVNHWNMERFFQIQYDEGQFSFVRLDKEIERYEKLDGCYVIRSNKPKDECTSEQLRDRYKDLKHVEQLFRTMKTTDIQTRPIRHFNEAQVRGHIFACFLAYRVIWELRQRLHPVLKRDPESKQCEAGSLADIWCELGSITVAKLMANNKIHLKLATICEYAKKLLTLAKVPSIEELIR